MSKSLPLLTSLVVAMLWAGTPSDCWTCLLASELSSPQYGAAAAAPLEQPRSEPTPDPLAVPVLPENPTQVDLGNEVYYLHCMPCHGDQGQGLTDEWREVWVEDHRNCWAPGCHAGRVGDEGFPIPRYVPDVVHLARFPRPVDLFDYLQLTHPPQHPGTLLDEEYWSVTALLLHKSGRLESDDHVGPTTQNDYNFLALPAVLIVILFASLAIIHQTHQSNDQFF